MRIRIDGIDSVGFVVFQSDFGGGVGVWSSSEHQPVVGASFDCELDLNCEFSDLNITTVNVEEMSIACFSNVNAVTGLVDSLDDDMIFLRLGETLTMISYCGNHVREGQFISVKCPALELGIYPHDKLT